MTIRARLGSYRIGDAPRVEMLCRLSWGKEYFSFDDGATWHRRRDRPAAYAEALAAGATRESRPESIGCRVHIETGDD